MKADFSGWATKAGLLCSDGRTIMAGAFKHQDQMQVPLVWQHGHSDPENVLGHVLLENREDGVYAYAFFNNSKKAEHARELVEHRDINSLSIWANELVERSKKVFHGAIREVSLVMAGANPGARIENITIRHSDGDDEILGDEVIIYTGLELEHSDADDDNENNDELNDDPELVLSHADDETIQDIYNSMNEKQKKVLHYMIAEAMASSEMKQSVMDIEFEDEDAQTIYDSMTSEQQAILQHMIDDAIETTKTTMQEEFDAEKGNEMTHNVFEQNKPAAPVLSHSDIEGIMADATKTGSLREAFENYALSHNITDIDILFPDAQALDKVPEFLKRRTEWVNKFLGGTRKSPFSRIKTLHADITMEEARAKGYVTGAMKKEEFFSVSRRITTPTTVYKKQKLDRDDMIDITDFDVVMWLKGEMRVMLDEEIARAALLGDGRDVSHEDKINEGNIRPIATDHEVYVTTINVNLDDASSSFQEVIDAIVMNRGRFRGTGMPTLYTTETYIAQALLLKDGVGRRIYRQLDELATELRVSEIVPVEVMEEEADMVGIIVNPADYVMGADKGGQVSMFDDFDIDYNQYKYLIETRLCGALTKMKSAMVIRKVGASDVAVLATTPTWDSGAGEITIPTVTNVTYHDASDDSTVTGTVAVDPQAAVTIYATANTGYYFASNANTRWTFINPNTA